MDSVVKKSLAAPIKQFTCCVSAAKDSDSWSSQDANQLKAVGGKVALPRELAAMVRPEASSKDEGYSIFSTFQGFNLNLGMLTGSPKTQTPTDTEQCRVM
ncbi:hypothetical protein JZ751_008300 [Albula glossodonta]|uniref:Uncharacterized protein n=1 Tax=Albula glossodonta TaxID=121402 RepID=A0A8T2N941_9TELE|nr:hypothetical protein JZ751_008300 [Albula glossodonta]